MHRSIVAAVLLAWPLATGVAAVAHAQGDVTLRQNSPVGRAAAQLNQGIQSDRLREAGRAAENAPDRDSRPMVTQFQEQRTPYTAYVGRNETNGVLSPQDLPRSSLGMSQTVD